MKLYLVLVVLCLTHLISGAAVTTAEIGDADNETTVQTVQSVDIGDAIKNLGVAVLDKATNVVGRVLEKTGDIAVNVGNRLKDAIKDEQN